VEATTNPMTVEPDDVFLLEHNLNYSRVLLSAE
jgi:hypothetical protein